MKILLLGDFSSLYLNLKTGLEKLGHDVVLASHGDGWKNIDRDIDLKLKGNNFFSKIINRFYPFFLLKKLSNFDIVQIINPFMFNISYFPSKLFFKEIKKRNKKVFLSAAGDDAYFWKFGRNELEYGPFEDFLKYDLKKNQCYFETEKAYEFNNYILELVDGVIPIMYEYEISYRNHSKLKTTIPIPINTEKIKYTPNIIKEKIVIFHGLNRYGFKGTRYVEEAFKVLKIKYPDNLELIIDGKMPLESYLKLMERTNIVIDQTNSYSLGVNGVYALSMGKIVLGGAEPESLSSLGVKDSPVINIKPTTKSIVEEIEKLLKNKNDIEKLGYKSRKFAEKVHKDINIAKKYLELWGDECVE
jgi:hypothetical protein